jgi:hypothetical protein
VRTGRTGSVTRMAFRVGAAAAIAAGAGLAMTTPALAGGNGQQVYINAGPSSGFATIIGHNQDGSTRVSPSIRLDTKGYGQLDSWWWKNTVEVNLWNSDGSYAGARSCDVPESQWSNWTAC